MGCILQVKVKLTLVTHLLVTSKLNKSGYSSTEIIITVYVTSQVSIPSVKASCTHTQVLTLIMSTVVQYTAMINQMKPNSRVLSSH